MYFLHIYMIHLLHNGINFMKCRKTTSQHDAATDVLHRTVVKTSLSFSIVLIIMSKHLYQFLYCCPPYMCVHDKNQQTATQGKTVENNIGRRDESHLTKS